MFGPLTMMAPSGGDMMVSFMVGERMSDYMYDWMSGGAEAMVMINANLVPDASAMEGMRGAAGATAVPIVVLAASCWHYGSRGFYGFRGSAGRPGHAGRARCRWR